MNKNTIHKITCSERKNSAMLQISKFALAAAILFGYQTASAETGSKSTESKAVEIQQAKKRIKGAVLDKSGMGLAGVTVSIEGTTSGATMTDVEGNYVIDAAPGETLVFSYAGMKPHKQAVGASDIVNVNMEEDAIGLDAAIVIGYGTTTERKLVSAVTTVNTKQLASLPVANVTQGLAGRAAGLIVSQDGGGLGNTTRLSIRGGGTPMVSIDGVITDYNAFVNLNADDIDQMSLLKDASATAVYGSRAGDGIIVVRTKKGQGKATVNYSFSAMLSQLAEPVKKLDSYNKALQDNALRAMYKQADRWKPEEVEKYRTGSDPYNYANTDWYGETLSNVAPEYRHNLSISGGDDKNSYYVSFGIYNQQSLIKSGTNYLDRYNYRIQTSNLIESIGLRLSPSISGYIENTNSPVSISSGGSGVSSSYYYIFGHMQNSGPMAVLYNQYGQPTYDYDNPVIETSAASGYGKNSNTRVIGQLDLEWSNPNIPGLTLRANGNYTVDFNTSKTWNKTARVYDLEGNAKPERSMSLSQYFYKWEQYTLQYFADYSRTFGKHYVSALVGYELSASWNVDLSGSRKDFTLPMDQMIAGPENTQTNASSSDRTGRAGLIARLKYDYNNRYIVEGSMRYDGSDRFPPDKRWGMFYAGAVGWNISSENFFQVLKDKNIFNFFKIRANYGQTGIDGTSARYLFMQDYGFGARDYVIGGSFVPHFWEKALPSPDISWYTNNTLDVGFDFESLNSRLKGSFSYFYYVTEGFLGSPSATSFTDPLGISLPQVRSNGEQRRAGVDFSLAWNDKVGDFEYTVGGNFTYFDSMNSRNWTESLETLKNPYNRWTQRTGAYRVAYKNEGFFQDYMDVYNSPNRVTTVGVTAGDLKYEDFNGDGKLDGSDQIVRGAASGTPRINYGIFANLAYRGFFLNILFQGAGDQNRYLGDVMQSQNGNIVYEFQQDYWTPQNTNAKYPRPVMSNSDNNNNNIGINDFWFVDARYIRLKNVQLGYNFKERLLKNSKWLSRLELSLSAQNLFTISPASKYGIDPEVGGDRDGINNYFYPTTKTYSISLNIGF